MSDNFERDEDAQILQPIIDEQDVDQEQALLRLENLADHSKGSAKPRKDFIRQRLKTAIGSQG